MVKAASDQTAFIAISKNEPSQPGSNFFVRACSGLACISAAFRMLVSL
jgi:hypothetical protein